MGDDYATRLELAAVERELRQGILETERVLRGEFTMALREFRDEVKGEIVKVDQHLHDQDELLRSRLDRRAAWWEKVRLAIVTSVMGAVASGAMYGILHVTGVLG